MFTNKIDCFQFKALYPPPTPPKIVQNTLYSKNCNTAKPLSYHQNLLPVQILNHKSNIAHERPRKDLSTFTYTNDSESDVFKL